MTTTALGHYSQENISAVIRDAEWTRLSEGWKIVAIRVSAIAAVLLVTAATIYANPIAGALVLSGLAGGASIFEDKVILPYTQTQEQALFQKELYTEIESQLKKMENWTPAQYTLQLNGLMINPDLINHTGTLADLKPLVARALVWQNRAAKLKAEIDELLTHRETASNVGRARDLSENYLAKAKISAAYYLKLISSPDDAFVSLNSLGSLNRLTWKERVRLYDHVDQGPYFHRNSDGQDFSKADVLTFLTSDLAHQIFNTNAVYHPAH